MGDPGLNRQSLAIGVALIVLAPAKPRAAGP
jgi:hypothetical protein